jgi:hypothetical protein
MAENLIQLAVLVVIRVSCLRDAVGQGIPCAVRRTFQEWDVIVFMVTVYVIVSLADQTWYGNGNGFVVG